MNLFKLGRTLRPSLGRQFPRLPPQIPSGGGRPPPRTPTGPDIEWEPIEPQKPMQFIDYTRERRDWRNVETPDPETVVKDISGCMLSFNMACLKIGKKVTDKIEERQEDGKTLSATNRAVLQQEMRDELEQAREDFRKCLVQGKSSMTALYEEFVKTAEETAQDQVKSMFKSVVGIRE